MKNQKTKAAPKRGVPPPTACSDRWCPSRCPITWEPFFMWIEHPTKGMVPTYGGPFDSYTIPEPNLPASGNKKVPRHEVQLYRERFDHDEGAWVEGDEVVNLVIVSEEHLIRMEDQNPRGLVVANGKTKEDCHG